MNELFKRKKNPKSENGQSEPKEGAVLSEREVFSSDGGDELAKLRSELEKLRAENDSLRCGKDEEEEFRQLFGIPSSDVPKQVALDASEQDIPLAAVYALYLAKEQAKKTEVGKRSETFAKSSPGAVIPEQSDATLTIDQIKRMPQSSVRKCYTQILKSLEN